jgi:acyl-CoA reductase-like NAD-dependent aldehyde dehydrogenase
MKNYKLLINGKLTDAVSGKTYPVINPATEETVTNLPLGGKEEVNIAVEAAKSEMQACKRNSKKYQGKYRRTCKT